MDNGYGNLADKFSGLGVRENANSNNDNLFQVMKAVEAAEATIKQQVEENNRLREELYRKAHELEKYKSEESVVRPHLVGPWDERFHGPYKVDQSVIPVGGQDDRIENSSGVDTHGTLAFPRTSMPNGEDPSMQPDEEKYPRSSKTNGTFKVVASGRTHTDNHGFSQLSSPSTTSFSPGRYQSEGGDNSRLNLSGHGLMQIAEVSNPTSLWKQDPSVKMREQEEEIMMLRKRLTEYSIKEAQIRSEKSVLEKRIAHMRLAFDQQQQDLVDAASKALSYRQEIIEENIRLSYALQSAQQERSTFVSSLLPLLAEYSLQPPSPDAQSIVSNLKVLFKHFQEKLNVTEEKLKESQYQLTPWQPDMSHPNVTPQSPSRSLGGALTNSNKNGLELVPQPAYSDGMTALPSNAQPTRDWDFPGHHQNGLGGPDAKTLEPDDMGRFSPPANRNSRVNDAPAQLQVSQRDVRTSRYGDETTSKQVTFSEPVSNSEIDQLDADGHQNDRDPASNWSPGNSPYSTTPEDPNSAYSPYLPPVLEEPSSSFSEAADDDPLPAIEGLQISGEAYPGHELQACGYSINGTTSCNFEWVRHWEDGSVNYIEGAKQPNYLVTADDVDAYLAIEVQPLDNRKRKGELVKVYANEHRKITVDPEMHSQIEKALHSGHASFKVSLSTGYLDICESATLAIKREGYSIKCSGPSGTVVTEKFSPSTQVTIPYGHTEFLISGSGGVEHFLRAEGNSADVSCSRDTIVLILRLFILRAGEKRKVKKRNLFFNK